MTTVPTVQVCYQVLLLRDEDQDAMPQQAKTGKPS